MGRKHFQEIIVNGKRGKSYSRPNLIDLLETEILEVLDHMQATK